MAVDPMTGQMDTPFIFDLAESIPGISTTIGVNMGRYSNTLLNGGRFDVAAGASGRRLRRATRQGAFLGDSPVQRSSKMFIGRGAARRAANSTASPFVRQSLATNLSPMSIGRLGSMTALSGVKTTGYYTPFQGISGTLEIARAKSKTFNNYLAKKGVEEGDNIYAGGVLGRMLAMNKIYDLQSKIATQQGRAVKAQAKLDKAVLNIARVQEFANPQATRQVASQAAQAATRAAQTNYGGLTGPAIRAMQADEIARAGQKAASALTFQNIIDDVAKDPLRATASTMTSGKLSNRMTSFYAGVLNPALMTSGQQKLFHKVSTRLAANSGVSRAAYAAQFLDDFAAGGKYSGGLIGRFSGGAKMVAMSGQYLAQGGSKAVAAKFAGMGAMRAGGALLGPFSVLATGQLIYDVTKGVGKIAAAGVGFARDAVKSMQGTINKPMFGAGFRDNEVAATSRSRGVMAIQNSRLNARSLLGSEAAMMAAHFG